MYDHSEDKENNAVVCHSSSILDIRRNSPALPDFTQSSSQNAKTPLNEGSNSDRRRPLGELLSEESPIASPIGHSSLTQSFAAKLQQASPLSDTLTPFLAHKGLQPAFDKFRKENLTYSALRRYYNWGSLTCVNLGQKGRNRLSSYPVTCVFIFNCSPKLNTNPFVTFKLHSATGDLRTIFQFFVVLMVYESVLLLRC